MFKIPRWGNPPFPHNAKQGLRDALWPHSLFGLVGVGIRVLSLFPPTAPFALPVFGAFAAWRVVEEIRDHKKGFDTKHKAIIDAASQIGWAAGGAFI